MADEKVVADCSGLQLSNNTFSSSPTGAMLRADNVVLPQKGVAEPRRGQGPFDVPATTAQVPFSIIQALSETYTADPVIYNSATSKTDTSYELVVAGTGSYGGGPWNPVDCDGSNTSYGRMKFLNVGQQLNFCTTDGPKVGDDFPAVAPRASGLQRMPDVQALTVIDATTAGASDGWLPNGAAVAYRTVLRMPLPNGTSLLSPPSGRAVISNVFSVAAGGLVRAANVVTATIQQPYAGSLAIGATFQIVPGEANFPGAVNETVASTPTLTTLTYADVAANATSTLAQSLDFGLMNVTLRIALSADATTTTPVRIYRSLYTSSSAVEPSDEMFLVAEIFPTPSQVSNGFILYNDITPQSVINDPLYTNPQTGEGIAQANYPPPLYRDIANFQGSTWYLNTTGPQTFRLQMLGVGTPDGVQDGDTITITDPDGGSPWLFTFKTTAVTSDEIQIVDYGTPSFNIQQTSQNLIAAVHAFSTFFSGTVEAFYDSAQDDAPGKILLQSHAVGTDAFQVQVSRPATWTPAFEANEDQDSTAERMPNGVFYSKPGQNEAVPLVNFLRIGAANFPALRCAALQQALVVFKAGDGIYTVSGSFPYQIQQISVANLIAVDAVCVMADNVWAYTDQGVLRISQSGGSSVVSRPIEVQLDDLRAELPDETYDYSFMVPYETERRLYLYVPFDVSTVAPELPILKAWVFNTATNAWTGPCTPAAFSGYVQPTTDKLLLGQYDYSASTGRLTRERKSSSNLDNADLNYNLAITAKDDANALLVELSSVANVEVGDGITQSGGSPTVADRYRSKVKRLRPDIGANWVELYEEFPWEIAAVVLYKAYDVIAQWQPPGSPTSRKTLTRLSFIFLPAAYEALGGQAILMTDQCQANLEVDAPSRGFGLNTNASGGGFGVTPFGDPSPLVLDVNPIAPQWTNAAQFFPGIQVREAWCKMRLQGWGALMEQASAPTGRGR